MEHDRPLRDAPRQVVDKKIGRFPGGLVGSQMHELFRGHDVPHRLPMPGLVDEDEGVDATVLLVCKAVRSGRSGEGRGERRVAGGELIQLGRLGCIGGTLADGHQQIAKLLSGGHREELHRQKHYVHLGPARHVELDGHAFGVGRGAVRDGRKAAVVGKAHGHGNAAAVEERRAAQCRRRRCGDKAAFRDHAFGVVDAEARMGSVDLVEGVHDLGRERGVVGAGRCRGQQAFILEHGASLLDLSGRGYWPRVPV